MLADETADAGERVVLADEPHGVGIALLADESDVARHVHIRRAAGHARHGVERRGADPVFDVGHIIVPEGFQPVEHEARGLKPDGAVGAVVNGGGAAAHGAEIVRRSAAIEDLLQKRVQPVQPHAAGNAFSAALRKTQLHERGSQIDRTAPERRRSAAASERGIQLVHLFLQSGIFTSQICCMEQVFSLVRDPCADCVHSTLDRRDHSCDIMKWPGYCICRKRQNDQNDTYRCQNCEYQFAFS